MDPDRWEFANEGFLRGQKHLLRSISRRKSTHVHTQSQPQQQQTQVQSSSVGACVEVGKFGLEEEVEQLKRDKNVLMQELVRLRQHQQTTDHQLQNVGQRVQDMEQRQQQMMSFLAKAVQSPGFLAQLVQQQNDCNGRRITGVNKKRRLPKQDEEILSSKHATTTPDGRVVKYQPLMNEAAKAMLRQILKMNVAPRREASISPDAFLIDNVPSSNALDSLSSSNQVSGVTLSEVSATSCQSYVPVEASSNHIPPCISETQSPPDVMTDPVKAAQFGEVNVPSCQEAAVLPDFSPMEGIIPESTVEIPNVDMVGTETGSPGYVDPLAGILDGADPAGTDEFSLDSNVDSLLDGIPKLPGINDAFWEQFLAASPLTGDTDEVHSSMLDDNAGDEQELQSGVNGWNNTQHMDHLTERMGLLASKARRV